MAEWGMLSREAYEQLESARLAPYAARAVISQGRAIPEAEDPYRTAFQRDRDRIIHSSAFRRLEYKTQVFVNHEGDYYRTRLTHSLEVAQIARGIARTLQLNEDVAEAIALAHDLGHTPFGHAGETVMSELMRDHGGFEHNHQSYRVVTLLEQRYPEFAGLNLTFEVLEGIVKHAGEYDVPKETPGFIKTGYPTIEAQVVNLADEIAYNNHDLDDGLQSGMLTLEGLASLPLWKEACDSVRVTYGDIPGKLQKHQAIRRLIHRFITDLQQETTRRIQERSIASVEDVRQEGKDLVAFSAALAPQIQLLKTYLFQHLYRHARVEQMAEQAYRVIADLFRAYQKDPRWLPTEYYARIAMDQHPERHICDYIAGMTDRFAFEEHRRRISATSTWRGSF